MTTEGIATALGISAATVSRELRLGQAWLRRALDRLRMNSGVHVNRWKLVEHIFHSALEFPLSDRAAYLARACGDDAELRSEVASLLENDRDDTATIHRAVDGDLKRLAEAADRSEIGERVGPYRLVRKLDGVNGDRLSRC
jgi:hypothetical protein